MCTRTTTSRSTSAWFAVEMNYSWSTAVPSPTEAAGLVADLEDFAPARVRTSVNTHAHFDHTFGNQQFGPDSFLDVPIYGHHRLPAHLDQYERPRLAAWHHDPDGEPERDWHDVRITPPTCLVAASRTLTVGERPVDLHPLGAGHTDTDLVLHVPDSRAWIVGDVVEASGPPMYGSGRFPLGLPRQLAGLLDELEDGDVVVPGHGPRSRPGLRRVAAHGGRATRAATPISPPCRRHRRASSR